MSIEKGIVEEVKEAVADDKHSIDEKAPGLPFALVALSYMLVLILAGLAVAAFLWVKE